MKPLDRGILAVLTVFFGAAAVFMFLAALGMAFVGRWAAAVLRSPLDTGLLTVIFAAAALYLGLFIVKAPQRQRALVHTTEHGTVRIAFATVKGLVERSAYSIKGVQKAAVTLEGGEDSLTVVLDVRLAPDFHIPATTEALQTRIRAYLRETVELEPEAVEVNVRSVDTGNRSRIQ